jgi:hypothetical protein
VPVPAEKQAALIEGAKRERMVAFATSISAASFPKILAGFTAK